MSATRVIETKYIEKLKMYQIDIDQHTVSNNVYGRNSKWQKNSFSNVHNKKQFVTYCIMIPFSVSFHLPYGFKFWFSLNCHGQRFPFESPKKSVLSNPVGTRCKIDSQISYFCKRPIYNLKSSLIELVPKKNLGTSSDYLFYHIRHWTVLTTSLMKGLPLLNILLHLIMLLI